VNGFRVVLTPEAQQGIRRLDPSLQTRILDKPVWMGQNARFLRHQSLQGQEWEGCFKYRVGDYRIIYTMDHSAEEVSAL
jgi:mRNA-degrading endonuclease RelE of RelBE toxin-antitoxin system